MSIPLLEYSPTSQNQRVTSYEVPGEEQPRIYSSENLLSGAEMDDLITAAYRQVFHEQQMLLSNRQRELESQLRMGQITVRGFIKGLVLSEPFRQRNYEVNNNYRFTQMCVQRLLGRDVYQEKEKIAWSIVLATSGLEGFINALLDSEEYMNNFGYDIVPYQRRRILPQRVNGELPFERMPRYGEDHRRGLEQLGYFSGQLGSTKPYYPPASVLLAAKILTITFASILGLLTIAVTLAAWGIISL